MTQTAGVPLRVLFVVSFTLQLVNGLDSCFAHTGNTQSIIRSNIRKRRALVSIVNPRANSKPLVLCHKHSNVDDCDRYEENGLLTNENFSSSSLSRRSVMQTIIASSLYSNPQTAAAATAAAAVAGASVPDLRCLLDLPPPPANSRTVRIYLCRHGQTEYNRLGMMQGSRIDAALNNTGQRMAVRLGKALSYLDTKDSPSVATHSSLIRSKETAYIAAATIAKYCGSSKRRGEIRNENVGDSTIIKSVDSVLKVNKNNDKDWIPIKYIPSLNEVDFGPVNEGKPVKQAKVDMYKTYATWSLGKIDATPGGGGETGRQVLWRAGEALNRLAEIGAAVSNGGKGGDSVVAVSHGVFLRVVLALAMDVSLLEAPVLKQNNCCINVLDVSLDETLTVGPKSGLFGGNLSLAPKDFEMTIPKVDVVRVNEVRHLKDMLPV